MSATGIDPEPVGGAAGRRRLIAIVYADMVGYSRLISLDDAGTLQRLRTLRRALIDPAIREHGGKVVQTGGDSLLVVFDSIDGAVRCAAKVQQQMPVYDGDQPADRRIRFRIGINMGDAIPHGTDLHGEGVNIAARLEAACPPGGLCVSRAVRDQVHSRLGLTFEPIGSLTLKNIPQPVEAYVVHLDSTPSRPPRRARGKLVAGLAGLLLIGAAGTGWWLYRGAALVAGLSQAPSIPKAQTDPPLNVGLSNAPPLSLVVLPFENTGEVAADNYLATGITDDLTTELSHIPAAFVISRATAYTYRGKAEDIRQIGRDLGIRYVVRGSVQRLGPVLRINAELGSTETGAQLWSAGFNQKIDDLAEGQDQIVIRMRSALNVSLVDIEAARSLRDRPTNPNAFDLILRARAVFLQPMTKETLTQAMSLYEMALQRDQDSVLALCGAAMTVLNELFYEIVPYDVAIERAHQYVERAQRLQPNAEQVLIAQANLLDWQQDGLNYRRVRHELEAVAKRLIEYYPNSFAGYNELGVLGRNQGRYDEAINFFKEAIRLNPRAAAIKNLYWDVAFCNVYRGHDREGLEWADRALAAAGTLPSYRISSMLAFRAVAAYRTGDVNTAERLARELNDQFPFNTWRQHSPDDPESDTNREQIQSLQRALKAAGNRDHLDPDADFGVPPDDVLHEDMLGKTPTTAPGVTTLSTQQFAQMLDDEKPLVIDTMSNSWYRSVQGAVGLDFRGNTHGTFDDEIQKRLDLKVRELTGGNMGRPIVAMSFNVSFFDGYNLALRLRHAGYTNVYWYRGGREAWEVAGRPEEVVRPADW
ncbi:MAG: adenylate/guanylate cyclase domain-containing protein [Acetobacteraceae bacterium]